MGATPRKYIEQTEDAMKFQQLSYSDEQIKRRCAANVTHLSSKIKTEMATTAIPAALGYQNSVEMLRVPTSITSLNNQGSQ